MHQESIAVSEYHSRWWVISLMHLSCNTLIDHRTSPVHSCSSATMLSLGLSNINSSHVFFLYKRGCWGFPIKTRDAVRTIILGYPQKCWIFYGTSLSGTHCCFSSTLLTPQIVYYIRFIKLLETYHSQGEFPREEISKLTDLSVYLFGNGDNRISCKTVPKPKPRREFWPNLFCSCTVKRWIKN